MSYDNDSPNWVYFDDFKVTHTTTNVIQYNEYYPFGLRTENSWTREDHSNKFLYNAGSELNANSGWYETFFRGYDAALGRFMQVDPLASVSSSYSPYNYAYNNPVLFNDPLGDRPEEVMRDLERYGGGGHSYQMYDYSDSWGQGFGNNQYGQHRISGSQFYGGMMSATAFYQKAMSGHGGYWENGMATMYQYDREAEKYFDFEQYTHAIDHGEGWYGVDNGIQVNRYEWTVGIKATQKAEPGKPCTKCPTAKEISNYIDPAGLIVDGIVVTAFGGDGTVMKMQSGQKLLFYDKRIVDILKSSGAASKAITVGTILGKTGTALSYGGIALTWVQVGQGDKHWIQGGMDTVVGIVGIAAPGPGTVVSVFYFLMTRDLTPPPSNSTDPEIMPMDNTYVAPSYKSMLHKTGN